MSVRDVFMRFYLQFPQCFTIVRKPVQVFVPIGSSFTTSFISIIGGRVKFISKMDVFMLVSRQLLLIATKHLPLPYNSVPQNIDCVHQSQKTVG